MSSVYIHIPFCSSKCGYCNFFSQASIKQLNPFISALLKEIELQKNYLCNTIVETIYFGGGTPSVLSADEIQLIIDAVYKTQQVVDSPEITLEANPEHLSVEYLKQLKQTSVNRLSIGMQSFNAEALYYLGRKHSASDSIVAIKNAQDVGFTNISADLIFGIPVSESYIESDIQTLLSFGIPHISAYALTVEENTTLHWSISKGKCKTINEQQQIDEFKYVMKTLKENNYHQYEISNYCRDNNVSKHNSNYWKQSIYLGLGPSAHSFNITSRQWNCNNITDYIQSVEQHKIPFQLEELSDVMRFNEYIMTSIRTSIGCSSNYIAQQFNGDVQLSFINHIKKHIFNKNIVFENNHYKLTETGILLTDLITSDLFA